MTGDWRGPQQWAAGDGHTCAAVTRLGNTCAAVTRLGNTPRAAVTRLGNTPRAAVTRLGNTPRAALCTCLQHGLLLKRSVWNNLTASFCDSLTITRSLISDSEAAQQHDASKRLSGTKMYWYKSLLHCNGRFQSPGKHVIEEENFTHHLSCT
jgi:hypothetical protein